MLVLHRKSSPRYKKLEHIHVMAVIHYTKKVAYWQCIVNYYVNKWTKLLNNYRNLFINKLTRRWFIR